MALNYKGCPDQLLNYMDHIDSAVQSAHEFPVLEFVSVTNLLGNSLEAVRGYCGDLAYKFIIEPRQAERQARCSHARAVVIVGDARPLCRLSLVRDETSTLRQRKGRAPPTVT